MQRIVEAIDRVCDELFEERNLAFIDDAERKAFYYERRKRGDRRWAAAHVCMYPSCSGRSITRSHTLSRSGPLERIADNGHVVTPTFDRSNGILTARRIGIRDASTFPGFCETHEAMFHPFEQRKELSTLEDHVLQFFRLVCREIRVRELEVEAMRTLATEHRQLVERRGTERIRELLGTSFLEAHKVGSLQFREYDRRHTRILERVRDMEQRIASYQSEFLAPLHAEIEGAGGDDLTIIALSTNVELPVCLGGRGNFFCQTQDGAKRETIVFGNVWPSASGTAVALLARKERHDDLSAYLHSFLKRPLGLLSLIETWMVHGTDHWFMRPSDWNAIPQERQSQILADILDDSRNVGSEYPCSIFDTFRTRAAAEFTPSDADDAAAIGHELEKMQPSGSGTLRGRGASTG